VKAVDQVSFSIERGEVVGLIGPNGAGKSTTVKMLTGVLSATSGTLRVAGRDPHKDRRKNAWKIGVVFGQRTQLWWDLPVRDSFDLAASIYRIPAPEYKARRDEMCELLDLGPLLDRPVRSLSLGQRVRADIAAALLHSPEILFLDEPTIGVDLKAKQRIRSFLEEANRTRGVTILITSHDMVDIERNCQRIIVFDKGKVIVDDALDAVRSRFGNERTLVVTLTQPAASFQLDNAHIVKTDGEKMWIRFDRASATPVELLARLAEQVEIRDFALEETGIERTVECIYDASRETKALEPLKTPGPGRLGEGPASNLGIGR